MTNMHVLFELLLQLLHGLLPALLRFAQPLLQLPLQVPRPALVLACLARRCRRLLLRLAPLCESSRGPRSLGLQVAAQSVGPSSGGRGCPLRTGQLLTQLLDFALK
jgi:hypothetical protein